MHASFDFCKNPFLWYDFVDQIHFKKRDQSMKRNYKLLNLFVLLSVPFLPGCMSDKKESDTSKVLISIEGKAALTEKQLEDFIGQALEANPQAKMMYTMMPEALKQQAFEAKKTAAIMAAWAKREGIRESAEYKKKYAQVLESVHQALDQEFFVQNHKPTVTDEAVVAFYEQHKHEPQFVMTQAGVKVVGVEFDTKDQADKFAQELAGKAATIEKIAAAKKLKTKDFGIVNKDSFVSKAIKAAVEGIKTFPAVKVAKDDKKYVVLVALAKENAKAYALDDVKEGVRRMLEQRGIQEAVEQKIASYKDKYNVKIDENYINDLKAHAQQREEEFKQKIAQEQGAPAQGKHQAKELGTSAA